MTLPLSWIIVDGQSGELAETQAAYRMLMQASNLAKVRRLGWDTFTRPDSATLDTAESGQAWELQTGAFAVSSGRAVSSATAHAVFDVGRADVDVSAVVTPTSGAPGVAFRCGTTSADRLSLQLDMTNGFRLNSDAGILQTSVLSFTAGVAYTVRVLAVDNRVFGFLNGDQLIDYTLTAPEVTKYGGLTRCGLRNTGSASFTQFDVQIGYPAASGSAPSYANLPAGTMLAVVESGGSYIRPSARADLIFVFQGASNPGAVALENDMWAQTP